MADVVVTLPKRFGLERWLEEGDAAGEPWSGTYYEYTVQRRPRIVPGERVYVVYAGNLIGYAPLVRVVSRFTGRRWVYGLVRAGDAVAVTIDEEIKGFRGYRYRWWERSEEVPFPEWSKERSSR